MKIIIKTLSLPFAFLAFLLLGCGESISDPVVESNKEKPLGIMSVESSGSQVVLDVILKDQFKLQLFEGEVAGPQVWVSSTNRPASVLIKFEANTLTMGTFSGEFDTTGIRMATEFPEMTSGLKEILIATRAKEGNEVPILVKIVPTTTEEKATINEVEQ